MSALVHVCYLEPKQLSYFQVSLSRKPEPKLLSQRPWNAKTPVSVFTELKEQYEVSSIRLLLADQLSYLIQTKKPFDETIVKADLKSLVASTVPEELKLSDWDFQVTKNKTDQTVTIFAPVQKPFQKFLKLAKTAGIMLEGVVPVSIASLVHQDPIVGIALTDFQLPDESEVAIVDPMNNQKVNAFSFKSPWVLPSLAALFGGVFCLSIFTTLWFGTNGLTNFGQMVKPVNTLVETEQLGEQSEVTPTAIVKEEDVLGQLTVMLVGTPEQTGQLEEIQQILLYEGFNAFQTSTEAAVLSEETVVSVKDSTPPEAAQAIERALNGEYQIKLSDARLTESADYDLVIVVGSKLEQD